MSRFLPTAQSSPLLRQWAFSSRRRLDVPGTPPALAFLPSSVSASATVKGRLKHLTAAVNGRSGRCSIWTKNQEYCTSEHREDTGRLATGSNGAGIKCQANVGTYGRFNRRRTGLFLVRVEQHGHFGVSWERATQLVKLSADGKTTPVPIGKPVRSILAFADEPNLIYATVVESSYRDVKSSDGDALYVSDDAAFSWRASRLANAVRQQLPGHIVVRIPHLISAAAEPRRVFVAVQTHRQGEFTNQEDRTLLLTSSDAGESWIDLSAKVEAAVPGALKAITAIAVHPRDPQKVMLAAGARVLRSTTGGQTWTAVTPRPGFPSVVHLAFDPQQAATVYAAGGDGVWISRDSGASWILSKRGLVGTEVGDVIHHVLSSARGTYAQGQNGLYRLSDPDRSWARSTWDALAAK